MNIKVGRIKIIVIYNYIKIKLFHTKVVRNLN